MDGSISIKINVKNRVGNITSDAGWPDFAQENLTLIEFVLANLIQYF